MRLTRIHQGLFSVSVIIHQGLFVVSAIIHQGLFVFIVIIRQGLFVIAIIQQGLFVVNLIKHTYEDSSTHRENVRSPSRQRIRTSPRAEDV